MGKGKESCGENSSLVSGHYTVLFTSSWESHNVQCVLRQTMDSDSNNPRENVSYKLGQNAHRIVRSYPLTRKLEMTDLIENLMI